MTFCKQLKSVSVGEVTVEAYEEAEKFSACSTYEIIVLRSVDGSVVEVEKTAKTTWKRKFLEVVDRYNPVLR
jgi:hypothetical protein